MKNNSIPIFKTKKTPYKKFSLEDRAGRQKYFQYKAGPEIKKIRNFLKKNTFVGFLMGIKNSGKGTHSKMFMEAIGGDRIAHISIGDIVRRVHKDLSNPKSRKELIKFLSQRYRGFITIERALDVIEGRDTKTLLPTEVILALVEREIDKVGRKAIFIDGFPRNLDQISYSIYFRSLMGYRDDPDFFVFIDVPEAVIDERMKTRVICPVCQVPRSPKLLRTKYAGYDAKKKEFYLMCDNAGCNKALMVPKEGDNLGIEALRDRIEIDKKVAQSLMGLEGVPKVYLRNAVPVKQAKDMVEDYELTPAYGYKLDKNKNVEFTEEPWVIKDDQGIPSHSLLPAAVAIGFIKQVAKALEL